MKEKLPILRIAIKGTKQNLNIQLEEKVNRVSKSQSMVLF